MKFSILYTLVYKVQQLADKSKIYNKKRLLNHLGKNSSIKADLALESPTTISIGSNSSIMAQCTIFGGDGVNIGNNVQISANCVISATTHPLEKDKRSIQINKKVIICDNVWIGMSALILPGVTIGKNSIVGAGSVVTKNVPADQIWIGNPAKFYKEVN